MVWAKEWGWSKPQPTDKHTNHRRKERDEQPLPPRRVAACKVAREASPPCRERSKVGAARAPQDVDKRARRRLFD